MAKDKSGDQWVYLVLLSITILILAISTTLTLTPSFFKAGEFREQKDLGVEAGESIELTDEQKIREEYEKVRDKPEVLPAFTTRLQDGRELIADQVYFSKGGANVFTLADDIQLEFVRMIFSGFVKLNSLPRNFPNSRS